MKFLFVDDENAYEGKIAEKIAFDVMENSGFDVQTLSRGLRVPAGKKMGNSTFVILTSVDLEPSEEDLESRMLTQQDIDDADIVMTMTADQKNFLKPMCPPEKLYTLFEYTLGAEDDLKSPKGYPMDAYRKCLCGIGEAFGTLLERWQNEQKEENK